MAAIFFGAACSFHAATQSPPVWFDTDGGDTWSLSKIVTGGARGNDCDEVVIDSPLGRHRALLQQERFTARIAFGSGTNRIVAVCIKSGKPHGQSAEQNWQVRAPDTPHAWIQTRIAGNMVQLDAGRSTPARGIAAALERFDWRERAGSPAPLVLGSGPRIEFPAPAVDGTYFVTLRVTDTMGRRDESTAGFRVVRSQPIPLDRPSEHPAWFDDAVVYGLAPSLLADASFSSLAVRLDEIANVAATVVWLSPVTEAPPGDFGYAVTDPFELRHALGAETQFRALLNAAHAHGIRVMLDAVTNHLAQQSPYFADTQRRGRRSPYYAWFDRDAAGRPVHYFDWNNLENLNYDDPEVRDFTLAALTHWIRDYPVDGMRLDAIWALRERAPQVLDQLRQELERVNPDIVLLAEASALDSYYAEHGFDAAYDWTSNLGQWAWHDIFGAAGTTADVDRLREALRAELDGKRSALKVLRFLNNNDTGKRFITLHGPQQTRIAAVLLFTLPGVPLIYAGDEVGAEFEPYNMKKPIDWRDRYGLKPLYRRLSQLRQRTPALRGGQTTLVPTDADNRVLAFIRGPLDAGEARAPPGEDGGDTPWLVVINFSASPAHVQLHPAEPLNSGSGTWAALNPIDGTRSVVHLVPHLSVELPGYGAVLLQRVGPAVK
ncbi:MAG: Alpha amylase, catalytic region [Gammaproteobacteria bacterium]|nr:Alpha amylase, catalytic region [Gammaproteobacteria bacterium]